MPARTLPADRSALPRYLEVAPGPALAPWVACYWSISATGTPLMRNRVLPDGCADVIVGLSSEPRAFVVGAMRSAAVVPLAGAVDLFGIRFRPGGALPFLDAPLGELTDRRTPLDALWGAGGEALGHTISSATSAERVALVERALLQRLRRWPTGQRSDERIADEAVRIITRGRGALSVHQIALSLGVGEKRLERAFDRSVGLTPKFLSRVLRLGHVVQAMERQGGSGGMRASWSGVAYDAGFADQSHLIREFRALAGVTPVQFARERASQRQPVEFVQDDRHDAA